MIRFFAEKQNIDKAARLIRITGSDANHIKNVLRMKIGDEISVSDGERSEYDCRIQSLGNDEVVLEYEEELGLRFEPPYKAVLFQGLPKSDKMELIIQKSVELGAYKIVPVQMTRSVAKSDPRKASKKTQRWQEISRASAKQSKRGIIPEVCPPVSFKEALKMAAELDLNLVPYELSKDMEGTKTVLSEIKSGASIGIFVGPEGGFEPSEIEACDAIGKRVSLGKRILRTETAGPALLSMLIYTLEL